MKLKLQQLAKSQYLARLQNSVTLEDLAKFAHSVKLKLQHLAKLLRDQLATAYHRGKHYYEHYKERRYAQEHAEGYKSPGSILVRIGFALLPLWLAILLIIYFLVSGKVRL